MLLRQEHKTSSLSPHPSYNLNQSFFTSLWIPSHQVSFSMTKQISIDTSLLPSTCSSPHYLTLLLLWTTSVSLSQAKIRPSLSFPLSLLWDQPILLAYSLLINALCYPHHTVEIHIWALNCCLELVHYHFLWHLQITIPSVQNVFTKGMCPISSFFSSVTFPMHSSADFIIQQKVPIFITKDLPFLSTSHLSPGSKRASFSSSLLWCLSLPVPMSCFLTCCHRFSADLTHPLNISRTTFFFSFRSLL